MLHPSVLIFFDISLVLVAVVPFIFRIAILFMFIFFCMRFATLFLSRVSNSSFFMLYVSRFLLIFFSHWVPSMNFVSSVLIFFA